MSFLQTSIEFWYLIKRLFNSRMQLFTISRNVTVLAPDHGIFVYFISTRGNKNSWHLATANEDFFLLYRTTSIGKSLTQTLCKTDIKGKLCLNSGFRRQSHRRTQCHYAIDRWTKGIRIKKKLRKYSLSRHCLLSDQLTKQLVRGQKQSDINRVSRN